MKNTFRSKVDVWLIILIVLITFVPTLFLLISGFSIVALIIVVANLLFSFSVLFSIKYIITENKLIIKYGFLFSEEHNLKEIKSIKPTHTLLAAPAASIDRLEISFGNNSVIVSPKEKKIFIELVSYYIYHKRKCNENTSLVLSDVSLEPEKTSR